MSPVSTTPLRVLVAIQRSQLRALSAHSIQKSVFNLLLMIRKAHQSLVSPSRRASHESPASCWHSFRKLNRRACRPRKPSVALALKRKLSTTSMPSSKPSVARAIRVALAMPPTEAQRSRQRRAGQTKHATSEGQRSRQTTRWPIYLRKPSVVVGRRAGYLPSGSG